MYYSRCVICAIILSQYFLVPAAAQDGMSKIDWMVGNWNAYVEARLSAQGPWDTSTGKAVIAKTVGSKVLEEDFSGSRENRLFSTKTLLAINNQTQHYQRIFVDSEHGTLIEFDGTGNGDGLIFDREWIYSNQSKVKLRVVYKIMSRNEFIVENMRMAEGASSWDVTGRIKYSRHQ